MTRWMQFTVKLSEDSNSNSTFTVRVKKKKRPSTKSHLYRHYGKYKIYYHHQCALKYDSKFNQ